MQALEIKIHNFRSIHDATIRLEALSLIAGANNAGKSNIIDAIRLFYGDLKWEESRDAPKVASSDIESWIEIEFLPSPDELDQLKDEYRSAEGTFRVRNYISMGPSAKAKPGYYAYENGTLSENLFYGAKNVGSGKIGQIVYIPAVSKVDENTKLSGPSALRDLVATVLNKVVAESPAYQELTKAFGSFEGSIKKQTSEDGHSLELLENEVSEELASWDTSFTLGIQGVQPEEILKTLIKPQLVDLTHGEEVDQSRFGAGFQRHLIYTLIKLAAKHSSASKKTGTSTKKEFSPKLTWILFEEPEAFLHPSQEEVLHTSLLELVKDDETQVLLTTHSSRFVSRSMDDLTRLVRLRRDGGVTTSYQLSQPELDKFFDDALVTDGSIIPHGTTVADLNRVAMMGALKTEIWMQATRTTAFFSQRVILVEGPSETAIYSYLTSRGKMPLPAPGVSVIDCMGKYNIHRFISLFGAFGIDHSVLYDGDNGAAHDTEVTAAIHDSKNQFTRRITRFTNDLESELGIPPVPRNQSNRKPQHALYHFETNTVTTQKLQSIIDEFKLLATAN